MSVIQVEDLVSYQLRTSYLTEVADGVGERLITLNENFLSSAPFKAAGWRPNTALIKRTHSPPIPTAIASEYFQAPRAMGMTLEDDAEEGSVVTGAGGLDTPGVGIATKRRRRREQMDEDDSSDLSDESDDEPDQRAAQQIRFAKMPVRARSGSSPIQSSNLRQSTTVSSPRAAAPRRGSQSALEAVKERARRDTVTSSEVSSENEFDNSAYHRQREGPRAANRTVRIQAKPNSEPTAGVERQRSDLLAEEEEEDDDDESDASDESSAFAQSLGSASILDAVDNPINASPQQPVVQPVVGTPPRQFTRTSTIRKSQAPAHPRFLQALPPPRPLSTIRPVSTLPPKSLLSAALKAKKTKPATPFESFASLSGQADSKPIAVRVYVPFSNAPFKPYEVFIRPKILGGESGDRPVTVVDLVGLSLWRYNEEKRDPPLPEDKLNVNWWTLRMVEEGGEVDDDFPPLERTKPLTSFTTANNKATRSRSNSKVYDEFALVQASEAGFAENQSLTPQPDEQEEEELHEEEVTPRSTPQPAAISMLAPNQARVNPVTTTTYRQNTPLADIPQAPASMPQSLARGQQKFLRIQIHSSDVAPGQMVTLDVTTEMYLEEVLNLVCRKRQLEKANHVLKMPGSGTVVHLDRRVSSIGNVNELDLHRRRFATDGPLTATGSPGSSSPRLLLFNDPQGPRKTKKPPHPLAKEAMKQDELGKVGYKKYTVWRKQAMRFVGMSERLLAIDGEYVHIMPASGGKATLDAGTKSTTVHFSNVVGCKVSRRHPANFKLIVYKSTEEKRYDFEARSADEAAEIVEELRRGISPYHNV